MFIEFDSNRLAYQISEDEVGLSLIEVMSQKMSVSSRMIRRSKDGKSIQLNGYVVSVNAKVRLNDVVSVELDKEPNIFPAEDIPIEVVFENHDLLVINKQPYVVVHPTKGHPDGTIGNGIAKYFEGNGFDGKIRFINRLDRDTSGLLLVAKNGYTQQIISNQMIDDAVEKRYMALVLGVVEKDSDTINLPIGRPSPEDLRRAVMDDGQDSVTHYEVVKRFKDATLVKIRLETGRTHQIRVHFAHLGHPLIGDELYGCPSDKIQRQALHSYFLKFQLPRTNEWITLEADLPYDFKALIDSMSEC
jgi:23S rRNA pseudouridine1911/1915/1917 synthase